MIKKKLILIDIDYTLFNAGTFREHLFSEIAEVSGISKQLCEHVYLEYVKIAAPFSPDEYIDLLLTDHIQKDAIKKRIRDIIFNSDIHKQHLYSESEETVIALGKLGKLGIFSQGHEDFQKAKLDSIVHYFSVGHIHIVPNKKMSVAKTFQKYTDEHVFLIDDSLPVLGEVKNLAPHVFTIWMKRGKYAENQDPIAGFKPDSVIVNLRQAIDIVGKN